MKLYKVLADIFLDKVNHYSINMISKVIFEDFGIFPEDISDLQQEVIFNKWLLNELFNLSSTSEMNSTECLNLQRQIMASCYVRRPMFFCEIVSVYFDCLGNILVNLSNSNKEESKKDDVPLFNESIKSLKMINPSMKFCQINCSEKSFKNLIDICKYIHEIGGATEPDLFMLMYKQIIEYVEMAEGIYYKLFLLDYIISYLEKNEMSSFKLKAAFHTSILLRGICSNIPQWEKFDLVTIEELSIFLMWHKRFYENTFWDNVEQNKHITDVREIVLIVLEDRKNLLMCSVDIVYLDSFLLKINNVIKCPLLPIEYFYEECSWDNKITMDVISQYLGFHLIHSEDDLKNILKKLKYEKNFNNILSIYKNLQIFQKVKYIYLNSLQRKYKSNYCRWHACTSNIPFDIFFGGKQDAIITEFIQLTNEFQTIEILSEIMEIILDDEQMVVVLNEKIKTRIILELFELFVNNDKNLKSVYRCNITRFEPTVQNGLRDLVKHCKESSYMDILFLNGWIQDSGAYLNIENKCILVEKDIYILKNANKLQILCTKCAPCLDENIMDLLNKEYIILENRNVIETKMNLWDFKNVKLFIKHSNISDVENKFSLIGDDLENIEIILQSYDHGIEARFLLDIAKKLFKYTKQSLETSDERLQKSVVQTIYLTSKMESIKETELINFIKMLFFFIIMPESKATALSEKCLLEIITTVNSNPNHFFYSHRSEFLIIISMLAVNTFLRYDIKLIVSLERIANIFKFKNSNDFTKLNNKEFVARILPYSIKSPKVLDLLKEIAICSKRDLRYILKSSFFEIYLYTHLNVDPDVRKLCIDFVLRQTEMQLHQYLEMDIKRSINDILIWFHKDRTFVLSTFYLLLNLKSKDLGVIIKYLAERFLGVLTSFEILLLRVNTEKIIKNEIIKSIAALIQFMGSSNIENAKFKIISLLTCLSSTLDTNLLRNISDTWLILCHNIDITNIEILLITGIEPLVIHSSIQKDVNEILKFIISKNKAFIPDFSLLQNTCISEEVRNLISMKRKQILEEKSFLDLLSFYTQHIIDKNSFNDVNSLLNMNSFLEENRLNIYNTTSAGNALIKKLIFDLLNKMFLKNFNIELLVIASKCLGELGAIESCHLIDSILNEDKSYENNLPMNVHSDNFAKKALEELCRAIQCPKDTKYVDNFSLAIQEIFFDRGVNPNENKKMDIWNTIPNKMKLIARPLLTSSYTGIPKNTLPYKSIVFNTGKFDSHEDWAFTWCSKIVEFITTPETRNLLTSFEPSMKRDYKILQTFLPYVLLHSLQECTDVQSEIITEEIKLILNTTSRKSPVKNSRSGLHKVLSKKCIENVDKKSTDRCDKETLNLSKNCCTICLDVLEFLERWLSEQTSIIGNNYKSNDKYTKIKNFLNSFDKYLLSKSSFQCNQYTRSLKYMELYITSPEQLQTNMSFLINIYSELNNIDCLEGSKFLKQEDLTLEENILMSLQTDQIDNIQICYEQILKQDQIQLNKKIISDLIECIMRIEPPQTVITTINSLWKKSNQIFDDRFFNEHKSEALWIIGDFSQLEEISNDNPLLSSSKHWGFSTGQCLLSLEKSLPKENIVSKLDDIRSSILKDFKGFGFEGCDLHIYERNYNNFIKLHQLTEIEQITNLNCFIKDCSVEEDASSKIEDFLKLWSLRLKNVAPNVHSMEPILVLRRALLPYLRNAVNKKGYNNLLGIVDEAIGKHWISTIKLYRKAGWFEQAQLAIVNAESQKHYQKGLFIEKAKLCWTRGDQTSAFKILEKQLHELKATMTNIDSEDTKLLFAQAKFLQASYNAESFNICVELNTQYFKEAINANKKCEKILFNFARYLDKIYNSQSQESRISQQSYDLLLQVMLNYARSMTYGCEFMYQSMPRLLSFWLDFVPDVPTSSQSNIVELQTSIVSKMSKMIEQCSSSLPLFIFYSAFSQIISRICHPSTEVFQVLKTIVVKLIISYPQQSMWMISPVFKSTYSNRQKRCIEIYQDKRLSDEGNRIIIKDFNRLADLLIELTNKEIPKSNTNPRVSQLVPKLPQLFASDDFTNILLPLERFMQITMPNVENRRHSAKYHNAFPHKYVYIRGIREEIVELHSLIRPRKVSLLGSDGKDYTIMMKPKDDLRKDFRLMEFNGLVKEYLRKNTKSRERNLDIRTYSVMPLNEECGLIEWVHNLETFRGIVKHLHKLSGFGMDNRELKKCDSHHKDPIEKRREKFVNQLLPRHPPVFYQWFLNTFPTSNTWYQARSTYIRSLAVMSVVGFILGLGDRHGENILMDKSSGDAVHVDFNCLFNLSESYQYAEKVPFRLTHSMVHAMGPLGVEGGFRKSCEISMYVMRNEMEILMSVLRPFVYDPLVAWNKSGNTSKNTERTDPKSMANLKRIEERLRGYVKIKGKTSDIPLSVEGQVNYLINEATDIDNLASMFIGWGSYV